MNDIAIKVEGLGKEFELGRRRVAYETLRDALTGAAQSAGRRIKAALAGHLHAERETFWALNEASFEIKRGEIVGIVGGNGAGKTTLLKILSRITPPSAGRAEIYGRVGALLEVGTGFHRELTGRENVYLNGAILGMKKAEIDRKFDAIVEFAELAPFIDTVVKHYSSGMYVRLAFSVAAHLEPEILLVDEVLSVGDAAFQRKCLNKMGEVGAEGQTVLFVSHDLRAINRLCPRVLLLEKGRVKAHGETADVLAQYLELGDAILGERRFAAGEEPGDASVKLLSVRCHDGSGESRAHFDRHTPIVVEIRYRVLAPLERLAPQIVLSDRQGTLLFSALDEGNPNFARHMPGDFCRSVKIPGAWLNEGAYTLRLDLLRLPRPITTHVRLEEALIFDIAESLETKTVGRRQAGLLRPELDWHTPS